MNALPKDSAGDDKMGGGACVGIDLDLARKAARPSVILLAAVELPILIFCSSSICCSASCLDAIDAPRPMSLSLRGAGPRDPFTCGKLKGDSPLGGAPPCARLETSLRDSNELLPMSIGMAREESLKRRWASCVGTKGFPAESNPDGEEEGREPLFGRLRLP